MAIRKGSIILSIPLLLLAAVAVAVIIIASGPTSNFEMNAFGQQQESATSGGAMTGNNMDLSVDPQLPFDPSMNERVMLSFMPKAPELEGASITPGEIDHLDYEITILQNGNEIWREQLHDHDGNLVLEVIPSSDAQDVTVSGGEENTEQTETAPYVAEGPVLTENGQYTVSASIVGIEFNPIPEPMTDEFNIQVVPEFPLAGAVTLVIAGLIVAIIFTARKFSGNLGRHSHSSTL